MMGDWYRIPSLLRHNNANTEVSSREDNSNSFIKRYSVIAMVECTLAMITISYDYYHPRMVLETGRQRVGHNVVLMLRYNKMTPLLLS